MDVMKNPNTEGSSRDYFHRGDFRVSLVLEPPFRAQVLHVLRSEFQNFTFQYDISKALSTVFK
jgi:hypothetical protein